MLARSQLNSIENKTSKALTDNLIMKLVLKTLRQLLMKKKISRFKKQALE